MDSAAELSLEEKVRSLFQQDVLLSAHHFWIFGRRSRFEPEKRLMLAVLEDAIHCFQDYMFAEGRKGRSLFRETDEWIQDEKGDWPFAFENICDVLEIAPSYLRQRLMSWKETHLARRHSVKGQKSASPSHVPLVR